MRSLRRSNDPHRLVLHVQGLRNEHWLLMAGGASRSAGQGVEASRRQCLDGCVRNAAVIGQITLLCGLAGTAFAASEAGGLTLQQRVLRPNEFKGFTPVGSHRVTRSVAVWAGPTPLVGELLKAGFVAGVAERLHSSALNADALSKVARFRTANGAGADVRSQLAFYRTAVGTYTPFSVPQIPGAHGYTALGGGVKGYNILFTDRVFQYLVGTGFGASQTKAPSRAQLINVAADLYRRVRGHPAP